MFRKSIPLLLALVFAIPVAGQVQDERLTVRVASAKTLLGVTRVKTFGEIIIFEGDAKTGNCAVVEVTTEAANISLDVSDKERNPTPYKQLDQTSYYIDTPGKHWVDVTAIDFEKNIYVRKMVIALVGPRPPDPPDPDDPDNPDPPPVPPDAFDNIGQRVAGWSEGLPSNQAVGEVYKRNAGILENNPSITVGDATGYIIKELQPITEVRQYIPCIDNIAADFKQRWPMTKQQVIEYWRAIALGLGVL